MKGTWSEAAQIESDRFVFNVNWKLKEFCVRVCGSEGQNLIDLPLTLN